MGRLLPGVLEARNLDRLSSVREIQRRRGLHVQLRAGRQPLQC